MDTETKFLTALDPKCDNHRERGKYTQHEHTTQGVERLGLRKIKTDDKQP